MPPLRIAHHSPEIKLAVVRLALTGVRFQDISRTLGMDLALTSVRRWVNLYQETRAVVTNPLDHMDRGAPLVLGGPERLFVLDSLRLDPTLYLDELQSKIMQQFNKHVSIKTLSTELRDRLCWTRKKARTVHPNQSLAARGAYMARVLEIDPRCLVFADETAIAKRRTYREYARAPIGERTPRLARPTQSGRWSALPAISLDGLLAITIKRGGYSRIHFEEFLENELLPAMNPWPARNSVLVLDNAPIHHGGSVADLCEARGVRLIYLPAYSPDLNPIEKGFSPVKASLRRTQGLQGAVDAEGERAVVWVTMMEIFTEQLCDKLFKGSGYM